MAFRLECVPFSDDQRAACLSLFDANCPDYFAPNERADYEVFLDGNTEGYRVGVADGDVIAAFGLMTTTVEKRCRLSWIMVARDAQGGGVGRTIMTDVLLQAAAAGAEWVDIAASHKSAPFFARFGARERSQVVDGWGPGMHRIDMELPVPRRSHGRSVSVAGAWGL